MAANHLAAVSSNGMQQTRATRSVPGVQPPIAGTCVLGILLADQTYQGSATSHVITAARAQYLVAAAAVCRIVIYGCSSG